MFVRIGHGFVTSLLVSLVLVIAQGAQASPASPSAEHPTDKAGEHGKSGGDAHNDPKDHSDDDQTSQFHKPIDFRSDLALFTFVMFLLLLTLLYFLAWKPIINGLDKREKGIADRIEQAHRDAEDAQERLDEYQARLDGADEDVHSLMEQARRDADAQKQKIVDEAKDMAQQQRDRAVVEIEIAKNQALEEMARSNVDTAIGLAESIVRRQLNKEDRSKLIKDALGRLPSKN